jgi:tetratricopeptide (TPR) repeat protein
LSSLPDPKDKSEEQNLLHSAMISADQGHSEAARSLLELNPDSPAALRQLGELEYKAGEYRRAAEHFSGVHKAHPDDGSAALYTGKEFDARVLLARVDLKLGERSAAEDQFNAVLLLDPANHDALLGLAQEELKEKRFTEVVDLLGPRVRDASASADLLQLLMQAYVSLGRTADAEKVRAQLRTSQRPR